MTMAETLPPKTRRIPLPEPGPDGKPRPAGSTYQPLISAALDRYQEAVVRLGHVDAVTAEMTRLKCARYHDCNT
jgi:hypothetical protein